MADAAQRAAGPIAINAACFGDAEVWRGSAIVYLKATLAGTRGGSLGGIVLVSAAAIGCVLSYVDALATEADIVGPGGGDVPRG